MKKYIKGAILVLLASVSAGCFGPKELQVRVVPLGEEVPGAKAIYTYMLPQTVLKVEVTCREVVSIPGPYWEYAERFLGITEVITKKSGRWQIVKVKITPDTEMDPGLAYRVNVLEGEYNPEVLVPLIDRGVILDGTGLVREEIRSPSTDDPEYGAYPEYLDLGIESNFEERTETMYKTIVNDTSFVQVPVDRTITEQKSAVKKAEEAADFLLELRSRRFDMLTGEYENFPSGEAMAADLARLDALEASYLSLFTGKTISRMQQRAWFIVPDAGSAPSRYRLGMFSGQLGFVPEQLSEGLPLEVEMTPLGKTRRLGDYFSGETDSTLNNLLYYRLPDVVELKVVNGSEELFRARISVYQSGALISAPVQ